MWYLRTFLTFCVVLKNAFEELWKPNQNKMYTSIQLFNTVKPISSKLALEICKNDLKNLKININVFIIA